MRTEAGPCTVDPALVQGPELSAYRTLAEVARRIPPYREGRRTHVSTLTRWILRGVRGKDSRQIRLRAVRFPGRWLTTNEWLDEFLAAVTDDRSCEEPATTTKPPARRLRDIDRVDAELNAAGF